MAIKYHISAGAKTEGELVECRAEEGACPRGGGEDHLYFKNTKHAEEYQELSLAAMVGEELSPGQELRFKELQQESDENNPSKKIREGFGESHLGNYRFYPDLTPGEATKSEGYFKEAFYDSKRNGKSIRDGRAEMQLSDKYGGYYGVHILSEDIINGGYLYGVQVRGRFYPKYRSKDLDKIIEKVSSEVGFQGEPDFEPEEY